MFDKAEGDYLKAIELDPDEDDFYLDLGDFYENNLNDTEKAKEYLKAMARTSKIGK